MTGLDTNVLARYIAQDDPEQTPVATAFLETSCTKETPGYVNHVVLCELVWVLRYAYHYPKGTVAEVLKQVLSTAEFTVETPDVAWAALRDFEVGNADYADYLIGHKNQQEGCKTTVTFDRRASKHPLFQVLE